MQVNSLPTFEQKLVEGVNTSKVWYRFLQALWKGIPPASESSVIPSGSPYTYQTSQRGFLIVQGGTIALIQFSRTPGTNYTTGQTQGAFPLSAGDNLVITYTAVPTLTFVPQ